MTNLKNNDPHDFLLTFSDIVNVAKKNKRKIGFVALIFAILGFYYAATKPIEYHTFATFKEKNKGAGVGKSYTALLLGNDQYESEVLTIMKSRHLVEQLVKEEGLQAFIGKNEISFPFPSLKAIKDNLIVEYALFTNARYPVLADPIQDITIRKVTYDNEIGQSWKLCITSPRTYDVLTISNQKIGSGTFGEPFISQDFSFTATLNTDNPEKEYTLTLLPLGTTAEWIANQFRVESEILDKSLIKITYKNRHRKLAASHIQTYMKLYQNHVFNESERTNKVQLEYLEKRQAEMGKKLQQDMHAYAKELTSDLSLTGFATSSKAMDFLANNQYQAKQKILSLDIEIHKLEDICRNCSTTFQKLVFIPNYDSINKLIVDMHALKQQADSLNLALRMSPTHHQNVHESFNTQLAELDNVRESIKEAKYIQTSLETDILPSPHQKIINNPKLIVNTWYTKLHANQQNQDMVSWEKNKKGFQSYLTHLVHYFEVLQHNLEERLAHQQAPSEFQGVNLDTAQEIYMAYSRDLNETESEAIQHEFIISQINDPDFEISSLSATINDPISNEMIGKTGRLLLSLKDRDNISTKEQERIKADIAIQKGFLITHLQQNIQLLKLRQQHLKEKIQNVQSINLSLIYEQISILENQIKNYLFSTIESLKREKDLNEKNIAEMHVDMAALPQKWAAEHMINQEIEINKLMIEEITKLVESKNINSNLEKIQALPVDLPLTPIHPKSPRLFMFALLGAFAGAFFGLAFSLARSVSKGIEASIQNLTAASQHVSGTLLRDYSENEPILDNDLNTLRRLANFMNDAVNENTPHTMLLLENSGPNYAANLATILSKQGFKVLVVNLCFRSNKQTKNEGLLQFLEGKTPKLFVEHHKEYDSISSGGITRFASELLSSSAYKELMLSWQKHYDWVIAYTQIPLEEAEAENLITQFSCAAISAGNKTWPQLIPMIKLAKKNDIKLTFVMS